MSNSDSFLQGLEDWVMGDVEVEVKVNQDGDAAPAAEPVESAPADTDTSADATEEATIEEATEEGGEGEVSEEATLYANLVKETRAMLTHLQKYGWDEKFVTTYNQDGRVSKTLGLRVPSMESLKSEINARESAITYAAIEGMEALEEKLVAKYKAAKRKSKK
jgi:hypothetical protein